MSSSLISDSEVEERRSAVHTQAIEDLRSLGISTPDLRLSLASTYIRELRAQALANVEEATIALLILWHAKREWIRAGSQGSVDQSYIDDAILWARRTFVTPTANNT